MEYLDKHVQDYFTTYGPARGAKEMLILGTTIGLFFGLMLADIIFVLTVKPTSSNKLTFWLLTGAWFLVSIQLSLSGARHKKEREAAKSNRSDIP